MAIAELKDPQLKATLAQNPVMFCKVMYNFFVNAISLFTNPLAVADRLSKRDEPIYHSDTFTGDGNTTTFTFSVLPEADKIDNVVYCYEAGDEYVSGDYDQTTGTVTFQQPPDYGVPVVIGWYYIGQFDIQLLEKEKYILSEWVMVCWSEYVNNNRLDIDRLLGDGDFKLPSNATTTNAKVNWFVVNRETVTKHMSKYAWDAAIKKVYK
ncbi:MAG: hypothetical protein ACOCPD_07985 [Segatella copri]|jgi:hypothetical protein